MKIFLLSIIGSFFFTLMAQAEMGILTQKESEFRAQWVSNISYSLKLEIEPKEKGFSGKLKVNLTRNPGELSDDLWLDHNDGKARSLAINGVAQNIEYKKGRLILPAKALKEGENEIEIDYTQEFSTTGEGLHKFKDPEDGEYYLYTQFEPYSANKMFPCFDQPDLKAVLSLTVNTPKHWEVISTTMPEKTKANGEKKEWVFAKTPKLSTYLFSLHAGAFQVWHDRAGNIPLRLFARKNMAKMLDTGLWFKITKQGLKFYGDYFGVKYPFGKYDQLIVPEFNAGAMENVAAVTFSERYLRHGKATRAERRNIADVVLHEMAHMWFGDLVTMKWWNDLWLNESFATFMASLALSEATEFKEAWEEFMGTKSWAMWEDQLPTTHPIDGVVESTDQAWASFDGITYGKGASVMKQLRYYVGDKAFRAGLQQYFRQHSYSNTVRKDFTDAIGKAAGKDLTEWSKSWLEVAGLDRLHSDFVCESGVLKSITLKVDNKITSTVRPHALELALLRKGKKGLEIFHSLKMTLENRESVLALEKPVKCPDLLLANYGDHAYLKVMLSSESINTLRTTISDIPDAMLRLQVWKSLWEMVRDQELSVVDYAEISRAHIGKEKNERVFAQIAASVSGQGYASKNSVPFYWPQGKSRDLFIRNMEEFFFSRSAASAPGSDQQKYFIDNFIALAASTDARTQLQGMLSGAMKVRGLDLDQDRRWKIVKRLCLRGVSNCDALIKRELKADKGDRAQNDALSARATQPISAIKEEFYKKLVTLPTDISFNRQRSVFNWIFPHEQAELHKSFADRYYDLLGSDLKKYPESFQDEYAESLLPVFCQVNASERLAKFIRKEGEDLPAGVRKALRVGLSEDERCQAVRAMALKK